MTPGAGKARDGPAEAAPMQAASDGAGMFDLRQLSGRLMRRTARITGRVGWYPAVPIRGGLAGGMRISMRDASGDYAGGINELPVQEALAALLRPGFTCYDIGANVGFFSLIAARMVGTTGHVVAFEPVPGIAERARHNVRLNRLANVTVLPYAIGERSGTSTLTLTRHPGGATLVRPTSDGVDRAISVGVVSVDEVVDGRLAPPPDLVKIDVEGAEFGVLAGMRQTMASRHPAILCELDSQDEPTLLAKVDQIESILTAAGYVVAALPRSYIGSGWHVVHLRALPARGQDAPRTS